MKPGNYACSSVEGIRNLPEYFHVKNSLILAASRQSYLLEVEEMRIPGMRYLNQLFSKQHMLRHDLVSRIDNIEKMIGKIYVRWYYRDYLRELDLLNIYLPENVIISKPIPAELDTDFIHNNKEYIITELSCDKKIAYAEEK